MRSYPGRREAEAKQQVRHLEQNADPGWGTIPDRFRLDLALLPSTNILTGERQHGFETIEAAATEDARRLQMSLRSYADTVVGGPSRIELQGWVSNDSIAHLMLSLMPPASRRCCRLSLASSIAMRGIRLEVLGKVLQVLEPYDDSELSTFTIINKQWRVTPKQLLYLKASTIRGQLRTHLCRAGVLKIPGPLIAYLHGEFEPNSGAFVLHFHGVTTSEKARALDALKADASGARKWGYDKTATGAAAIRRDVVCDRARQVSYTLKSFWPQRTVRLVDDMPKRDRSVHRIDDPHHLQVLLWLDRHKLTDICLLNNCRVSHPQ